LREKRLKKGVDKNYTIAIMCTEKDPIDCHRSIMISKVLYEDGYNIIHILSDGSTQTQEDLEDRLIRMYFPKSSQQNIFDLVEEGKAREDIVKAAYKLRNRDIGYRPSNKTS
jgi:uncharacterized protein (DUF488 family)